MHWQKIVPPHESSVCRNWRIKSSKHNRFRFYKRLSPVRVVSILDDPHDYVETCTYTTVIYGCIHWAYPWVTQIEPPYQRCSHIHVDMIVSVARDLGDRDVQDDVEEAALFETKMIPNCKQVFPAFHLSLYFPILMPLVNCLNYTKGSQK